MIDDFVPQRKKPKVIEPLPKEEQTPLPVFPDSDIPEADTDTPDVEAPSDTTDDIIGDEVPEAPDIEDTPARAIVGVTKKHRWPFNKKQTLIGAAVVVVLIGGGVTALFMTHPTAKGSVQLLKGKPKAVAAKSTTVASTLSGLQVDPSVNKLPVTGVMIENSDDARPQSGLNQASVVFEAVAEGGITRFLALYQDTQPDYIGPVRSSRPYYIQWCQTFDCDYAHVGGSPEALQDIKNWAIKDLDQSFNSGAYERISSRYAPHNVYTSITQLNQLETAKGYTSSNFTGFARKADQPYKAPATTTSKSKTKPDTRQPINSIDFALSGYDYNAHFDYNAATNTYKRSEGGAPHMELNKDGSQTQITPKVVIGMVMQDGQGALDTIGAYYSDYQVVGSGQAFIFQDGTVVTGTWTKTDAKAPIIFTDSNGKVIPLDAGQTWITALSSAAGATFK